MTEEQPNVFTEAMQQAESVLLDNHLDESLLSEAMSGSFSTATDEMGDLPEQEEEANAMMTKIIVDSMMQAFKAGMVYADVDPSATETVWITPLQATQVVTGLMSNGVTFRVDRG